LSLPPDEVLNAALGGSRQPRTAKIVTVDGKCAAVSCTDLYLIDSEPLDPKPARYLVASSAGLEYFLPEHRIQVKMAGPAELQVYLPEYSGLRRIYLGRTVTKTKPAFKVERSG
jgi:hypothetical protein